MGRATGALRVNVFLGLIALVVGLDPGQVDALPPWPLPVINVGMARSNSQNKCNRPILTTVRGAVTASNPVEGLRCNLPDHG